MSTGECKINEASESKYNEDEPVNDGSAKPVGCPAPHFELLSVDCGPSNCPVGERLELSMEFTLDEPLRDALWEIKFLVDSVNKRHVVRLGATDPRDYGRGTCSMRFEVPRISVEGIEPCTLANTGLLTAALKRSRDGDCKGDGGSGMEDNDDGEVAAVNLVVQVADAGEGTLMRCIYSPLE